MNLGARDRKGRPFSVTSLSVSLGVKHHAKWKDGGLVSLTTHEETALPVFPQYEEEARPSSAEQLGVSRWIATLCCLSLNRSVACIC